MGINWKVRVQNKNFWLAIIPAVLILIQSVAAVFGYTIDITEISGRLLAVADAVFIVLAILGVVADPTTAGISDSARALTYDAPHKD